MRRGELDRAAELLSKEPNGSRCFLLAQGNVALILLRVGRYQEAERLARGVLALVDEQGCPHPPSVVQFARTLAEAVSSQGRHVESFQLFNNVGGIAKNLASHFPSFVAELEIETAHAFNSWAMAHVQVRTYETAESIFRAARDIYARHAKRKPVGRAHVLTNLAHALRLQGKNTEAELALAEALDICTSGGDREQMIRVLMALAQLGSALFNRAEHSRLILRSIEADHQRGRHAAAYVRRCILAELAAQDGDYATGLQHVQLAVEREPQLDGRDLNPAKLRMTWAHLLELSGAPRDLYATKLIEGANLWFSRIADGLTGGDFSATTSEMHEHFRYLAGTLLAAGRVEDALLSFESGRALAHSVEVDQRFLGRVVARNPFPAAGDEIDPESLRLAQRTLAPNEALLSIAILPPYVVGFVITRSHVSETKISMPDDLDQRNQLLVSIHATPTRLQERVGARAVPDACHALAKALVSEIGAHVVRAIMPYSSLHDIPWRAVLHHAGLPWKQLTSQVEFGLLLRAESSVGALPKRCFALGFGTAGGLNLGDEARDFARHFGADAAIVVPCSRRDVETALLQNAIVLLSCHGKARDDSSADKVFRNDELRLYVSDGACVASELIPVRVRAPLVILSACESGVYEMSWADFPVGAAAQILRSGASGVVGARFLLGAAFSASFFRQVGEFLAHGRDASEAMALASEWHEAHGFDLWRDIACVELLGSPSSIERGS